MKEIRTEIVIKATPAEIWEVLTDFDSYPEWNPQIVRFDGRPMTDETFRLRVYSPDGSGRQMGLKAKIVDVEVEKKLSWQGGITGIFSGYHYWELNDLGAETKVIQGEKFYGPLSFVLSQKRLKNMSGSYEAASRGLEKYIGGRS